MSTIIHGPLPNDGDSVDPSVFLEAWINGSVLTDLTSTEFGSSKGTEGVPAEGQTGFIVSQTDPPATSVRFAGLFWFERGAGRLQMWDDLDQPSQLTSASGASFPEIWHNGADWLSMSERRELWVLSKEPISQGAMCFLVTNSRTFHVISTYSGSNYTFAHPTEFGTGNRMMTPQPSRAYWAVTSQPPVTAEAGEVTEVSFVALESAASGTFFRVAEWGFVDLLAHSGTTGSGALGYVSGSGASESSFLFPGVATQTTNPGRMPICWMTDSSATVPTDVWLRQGFKQNYPPWGIARRRDAL